MNDRTRSMATPYLTADPTTEHPHRPVPLPVDVAAAAPVRPARERSAELRRLVDWLRDLDVRQAATIHQVYNTASASGLITATHHAQIAAAQTDFSHAQVISWIDAAGEAITAAAERDTSTHWHGHWPVVSWASEAAVWGLAADIPRHTDTLTAPVRAAGFSQG